MGRIYDNTWGRFFSFAYDRAMSATEEAGLGDRRHELLSQAKGRTLDVGAGTGVNLEHYPDSVTELVLAEPDPLMVKRLRPKLEASGRTAEIVEAPAERLPFPDDDFDTVVVTLVLCTVPDVEGSLREIARVLKPKGRLLFIEHVRGEDGKRLAEWQDRLETPWRYFADGCHCNRDTLAALGRHFDVDAVEHGELEKAAPLVKPLIAGSARPARG
jgi:ubiquinone/menaquinone biosynthesis C-methylase UbiE